MDHRVSMSTMTVKGQVVIPAKLRKKVGLKRGTRVYMEEKDGDIIMHPITAAWIDRGFGMLKRRPGQKPLTRLLEEERARDRQREDRPWNS